MQNLIKKVQFLVFDLDGVIVDTNKANLLAYREAICAIINIDLYSIFHKNERFTQKTLMDILELDNKTYKKIIRLKNFLFKKYINFVETNEEIIKIIKENHTNKKIILSTNANKKRARFILKHFHLEQFFHQSFFKEDYNGINKYKYLLNKGYKDILIFEDNINIIPHKDLNYILVQKGKIK